MAKVSQWYEGHPVTLAERTPGLSRRLPGGWELESWGSCPKGKSRANQAEVQRVGLHLLSLGTEV